MTDDVVTRGRDSVMLEALDLACQGEARALLMELCDEVELLRTELARADEDFNVQWRMKGDAQRAFNEASLDCIRLARRAAAWKRVAKEYRKTSVSVYRKAREIERDNEALGQHLAQLLKQGRRRSDAPQN